MTALSTEEINQLLLENRKMQHALKRIAAWDLPSSTYNNIPCSYEAAHGSNGARDYVKAIAAEALK